MSWLQKLPGIICRLGKDRGKVTKRLTWKYSVLLLSYMANGQRYRKSRKLGVDTKQSYELERLVGICTGLRDSVHG
jgi:hypothetical protein